MSEATIRAVIKAVIDDVTDIGKTYNRYRFSNDSAALVTLATTTIDGVKQVRAWMVEWLGIVESERIQMRRDDKTGLLRRHEFKVWGYQGFDDSRSTETIMSALTETVVNALDDSDTLHDGATYYDCTTATAPMSPVVWAGVLCHRSEITLQVTEFI